MTDGFPSQKASNAASVGPMLVQRWHTTIGITLCQRWPNVSVPTLGRCWHNVGVQPLGQRWANWQIHVGPTLVSRHWPNVRVDVGPTLGQRRNASWVCIMELSHHCWLRNKPQCNFNQNTAISIQQRNLKCHLYNRRHFGSASIC